jgi:hypothetical protein
MADNVTTKKPQVHEHQDSGLHYLLGKDRVLFENGVALRRVDFEQWKDIRDAVQSHIEDCLATDPTSCGYDWKYACSTGQLRRHKGSADLVASAKTARRRAKQAETVSKIRAEEQKKTATRSYVFSSVFLVTVVMTAVGIGSAIMSAYHTSMFLIYGGKPLWTSVLTGTMLILFSGTAFTAARYFFTEGKASSLFGWLFVIAGAAVIVYSIFSTLTVNFNQFQWRDEQKAVVAVTDSEALAAHNRLLDENREALTETAAEIEHLESEASYWKTRSWRYYEDFQARIIVAQERRDELRTERTRLEVSTPELIVEAQKSQDTIYTFLGRLLGLPEDVARFFVYVIPACLYDVLAPFALSVVLLLADKRKQQDYLLKEKKNG